jgi:hypothetical protein
MYCPECGAAYRDGFTQCADCQVALSEGALPPDPASLFDPTLELVVVLETNDRLHLALAQGMLEEAGIPFYVLDQITTLIQDLDPFLHKWVRVQVPRDREAEARALLEGLLQPETSPGGAGEENESGDNI